MRNAILAAACAALAGPALSDEPAASPPPESFFIQAEEGAGRNTAGTLVHRNRITFMVPHVEEQAVETPWGVVVVRIERLGENCGLPAGCPDAMEVVDWPAVLVPRPLRVTTAENESSHITLFHYTGG